MPQPTSREARALAELLDVLEADFALTPPPSAPERASAPRKPNRPGEQQCALDLD